MGIQSVVDAQDHFVIDISATNDINDQNQLYIIAKYAADLLDVEKISCMTKKIIFIFAQQVISYTFLKTPLRTE